MYSLSWGFVNRDGKCSCKTRERERPFVVGAAAKQKRRRRRACGSVCVWRRSGQDGMVRRQGSTTARPPPRCARCSPIRARAEERQRRNPALRIFFLRRKPALRNYILPRPEGKPSSTQLWEVVGCALPWPPRRELPAAASTNITNHHPPTLLETLPSRLASRRRPSSLSLAAGGGTVGCNSPRRN